MSERRIEDQDSFLQHRKTQENEYFENVTSQDPLSALFTVEINTTELCNRTCVFCPRHDPKVFPNRNLHMTPAGAEIIARKLYDERYVGKISLSGFGENLLNPNFAEIVHQLRRYLPAALIECNTNGDKLTNSIAKELFKAGLDYLYINLYDGADQIEHFDSIMHDISTDSYRYRMHWDQKTHGLILNNRSGTIDWLGVDNSDIESLQGTPCYYPFYKMFVDWNGDVLFCSNDWGREHVVGNLMQQTLREVWTSPILRKIRRRLIKGDRSHSPCNKCSVNGKLFGERSFKILEHYETSNHGDYRLS